MSLRSARPDDLAELVALGRRTFADAFGHMYSEADLAAFLDDWRSPERIAANIANPSTSVSVIEDRGSLVAYCTTVFGRGFDERPEPRPANPAFLSQLYCDRAATGRGFGAMLMDDCLAQARERGCDAVQLSVWCENHGAQRFYRRYGFRQVAEIDFWVGAHRDDELLYELAF